MDKTTGYYVVGAEQMAVIKRADFGPPSVCLLLNEITHSGSGSPRVFYQRLAASGYRPTFARRTFTNHQKLSVVSSFRIYVAIQSVLPDEIEFDWDEGNIRHLAVHGVTPREFEQVVNNEPLDLNYESIDGEDRYRAVGLTGEGRLLTVVFTLRHGKVRGITSFPATAADKKAFLERTP